VTDPLKYPAGQNGVGEIIFQAGTFSATRVSGGAIGARKFFAGEAVSSVILGNPGPQPSFDPKDPAYKQVLRDLFKLTP
jgi:hypothetical protein